MKKYKRAYIEITNICNLNCSFCPITEREKSFMHMEEFESTIAQVAPLADQVCLHLMGEPLAHPNFKEIIELCEKYDAQIQLTTNGILLKRYADFIINSKAIRQVNISAQSYMDNFPNKDFTVYLDDIYKFVESAMLKRPELYLNIRLWNIQDANNAHCSDGNELVFTYFEEKLSIKINRNLELGRIKSKKLKERLYFHFDSRFEWPRLDKPVQSQIGRCNGLVDHFAIHADGSVVPCCLDDQKILNLGSLKANSLNEILNSELARTIKEGFIKNQLKAELCQKCTYINRFKK